MDFRYFSNTIELPEWFRANHALETELSLGFYKRTSATTGITYSEALDLALCFGWIDGIRKRVDDERFTIRFTPRKANSIWSAVNIAKVEELIAAGAMRPSGLTAFQQRNDKRTRQYSFEQDQVAFDAGQELRFRENEVAWGYFQLNPRVIEKPRPGGS